jgi:hypothetical protein
MGIEDMRVYQANRVRGHVAAAEPRDLLLRHAERVEAEIATQHARLGYLREKAAMWDARARQRRRHRTGRGQPDGHLRAHAHDRATLLDAADQGDARRDDECLAA